MEKNIVFMKNTNKKGSYTIEAAMTLPVFILVFTALALVVNIISDCEQIVFEASQKIYEADNSAPQFFPDLKGENYELRRKSYLYSYQGIDDLICIEAGSEHIVEYPFDILGRIDFSIRIMSRGFTGKIRRSEPMGEEEFGDGPPSVKVVIFPKYGNRFHRKGCRYVKQEYEGEEEKLEMEKRDAELKGYTPCLICGGGDE